MHKALIFNGVFVVVCCASVFGLRGKQARRERDEMHARQARMEKHELGVVEDA